MAKRGPAPGSGKSGGTTAAAMRGQGSSGISRALDRLEGAIRAAAIRQDIGYDEAQALFMRLDKLGEMFEATVVCTAADYPEEN
jgi:hypothetical protein